MRPACALTDAPPPPSQNFNKPVDAEGGKKIKYVDGLAVAQGPNYALAKRMQHWRAMIEFEKGAVVSSMVAPSTATISVLSNKTFAWAYGGMPYFKYEIFKQVTRPPPSIAALPEGAAYAPVRRGSPPQHVPRCRAGVGIAQHAAVPAQETTNAVMAAMLMHDTLNVKSPKNAANKKKFGILNSIELFSTQAVHGGLWRSPYKADSLGECSALIYFGGLATPYVALIGVAAAAAAALM